MFLVFLSTAVQATKLFLIKLELVQLTRNFSVHLARQDSDLHNQLDFQRLAGRTSLKKYVPTYSLETVGIPSSALPSGASDAISFVGSLLTGERLTVRCVVPAQGPMRLFFRDGAVLSESVVLKTDPWRNPGKKIFMKILGF
jgi:hypothetical protein